MFLRIRLTSLHDHSPTSIPTNNPDNRLESAKSSRTSARTGNMKTSNSRYPRQGPPAELLEIRGSLTLEGSVPDRWDTEVSSASRSQDTCCEICVDTESPYTHGDRVNWSDFWRSSLHCHHRRRASEPRGLQYSACKWRNQICACSHPHQL
jgi:hypothetical protein